MPDTAGWVRDRSCPKCGHSGRFLAQPSTTARVSYYRCIECGHVWCYDKDEPDGPHRDITSVVRTPPPPTPK